MVNFLMPIAGVGSRFVAAGYDEPKPLIDVFGEPMISWAMKSFDFLDHVGDYRIIFVILAEHDEKYNLGQTLKNIFGCNSIVVKQPGKLSGQALSCLEAKDFINNQDKLFIYNCDTYSTSGIWDLIIKEDPDGILPCFESTDPRYSFARVDENGYVAETAEKNPISNLATNGLYYFKNGSDFVKAALRDIANNNSFNNEYFVAPCYNELIKEGKNIRTILVDKNYVMGTPEELESFKKNYKI